MCCFLPAILLSSTYTDPTTLVFRRITQPVDDHTNFVQEVARDLQCLPMILAMYAVEDVSKRPDSPILNLNLGVSRYCVGCLSCTVRWSCNDIHHFCGSHLGRRRALFSKNCMGSRVVSYNVTSQHASTFIISEICVLTPHS